MKKISIWTKIFWFAVIVIVSINVAIQITGHSYLYRALIYTYAGIDDLDLFDAREVSHDTPQPWPLSTTYNKKPISATLKTALENYQSVAFLLIQNDSICYEQYWDHYDTNSISNSFSVAKSIVSTLTGIAVDEGKIKSIDDPVYQYLDWFNTEKSKSLTIRHLLTMSAGLNWDEAYSNLFSITTKAYYGNDLVKIMRSLKVKHEPGKVFNYQSGCTLLLGMIIEKATGKKLSDYASEKLWKPLGAEFTAQWSLDHINGDEKSFCCFYSSARDFARLGQLYLNGGKWNGQQIISEKWVTDATTPAPGLVDDKGKTNACYGYQWWILNHNGHRLFYARGIQGQYLAVIPDLKIVMVRLGKERGDKRPDNHLTDFVTYVDEVIKMYP